MDFAKQQYTIHFINEKTNKIESIKTTVGVPRVGDEIRLNAKTFFKVTLVVWIYDEPEYPYQRINIGVAAVSLENTEKPNN